MGKADQADAAEAVRLQQVLKQRHEELAAAGDDGGTQRGAVFAATKALLDFEAQLPRMREERRRRLSSIIVYAAAGIAVVMMMLIQIARMLQHHLSWWYLIAVLPVAGIAGLIAGLEGQEPTNGHRGRAVGAVIVALAAAFVVVVTAGLLSAFWLLALIPLLGLTAGFWLGGQTETEEAQ
ncbi:hypothetical protein [Krasilnikovia sp. M28-CT-15]|uniref:hypothetical protein n=1 Tax=Krasilnikovia sp. M28-CT-15 TaxID=3373540 RepID=UPI003876B385